MVGRRMEGRDLGRGGAGKVGDREKDRLTRYCGLIKNNPRGRPVHLCVRVCECICSLRQCPRLCPYMCLE